MSIIVNAGIVVRRRGVMVLVSRDTSLSIGVDVKAKGVPPHETVHPLLDSKLVPTGQPGCISLGCGLSPWLVTR
jgi:hypothetical protein